MKEELLKGLTEEQIAKVRTCKSQQELLAQANSTAVTGAVAAEAFSYESRFEPQ